MCCAVAEAALKTLDRETRDRCAGRVESWRWHTTNVRTATGWPESSAITSPTYTWRTRDVRRSAPRWRPTRTATARRHPPPTRHTTTASERSTVHEPTRKTAVDSHRPPSRLLFIAVTLSSLLSRFSIRKCHSRRSVHFKSFLFIYQTRVPRDKFQNDQIL